MGSKRSKSRSRRTAFKKRKFNGNRFTAGTEKEIHSSTEKRPNEVGPNNHDDGADFSTPKRPKLAREDDLSQGVDEEDYYMFVNFKVLKQMVTSFCKCPSCGFRFMVLSARFTSVSSSARSGIEL